jgi:valyl-tRNA synthetase
MAVLKEVVGACRGLRSEMGLGPGERVPLLVAGETELLERFVPYLATLAKVSDVDIVDELPSSDAPVRVVGETSLMLHIEVDLAAERERIAKEVARLEGDIAKAMAMLNNDKFIARAPTHVVDEHRARVATFAGQLEQLKTQLSRLSG